MHCYFVLAGNDDIPIIYHVEHVREGRSFATRTVQARQRGKPIFTTTMSFVRENSGGSELVEHSADMPDVPGPTEPNDQDGTQWASSPFESQQLDILNHDSAHPQTKKTRQWIRARGRISPSGGHEAHLSALAYMSDNYFIGTVTRVHKLTRALRRPQARNEKPGKGLTFWESPKQSDDDGETADRPAQSKPHPKREPEVGMMVSLDHTIYFHRPRDFRADEWIFTEMESPWAGDGRGLVLQRIFQRGKLIATCVQEVS